MIQGIAGIVVLLVFAWILSENRRIIHWRLILAGVILQVVIALFMLKSAPFRQLFLGLNACVTALEEATRAGTSFVFL